MNFGPSNTYCCPHCRSNLPTLQHETMWETLCEQYFQQKEPLKFTMSANILHYPNNEVINDLEDYGYISTHETSSHFLIRINGVNYNDNDLVFCLDFPYHNRGAA